MIVLQMRTMSVRGGWRLCRSFSSTASRMSAKQRTYADAITALNTLQANHATVERIRQNPAAMHKLAIPEMLDWLRKAGYDASDFNPLNAIHIAGTKGKGSTASFVSSILSEYTPNSSPSPLLHKIGLYTSPHLRFVRERIQINKTFISEPSFASAFFEIWDRLEDAAAREGAALDGSSKPAYFRYLTILALHTFLKQDIDTAVIECGTGGEYDSTNILQKPTVTGITSLGIDHTPMLGATIDKIAWHKAGIMKPDAAAFTVDQPKEAMAVLQDVAKERNVDLMVVKETHPAIKDGSVKLGLDGEFQKLNASLAIEMAAAHLRALGHRHIDTKTLPSEFVRGLLKARIGGRCETREDGAPLRWRIDGAHTQESMKAATEWYVGCIDRHLDESVNGNAVDAPCVLIFNQQSREGVPLLKTLMQTLKTSRFDAPFTHAIFCSNQTFEQTGYRPDLISINTDKKEAESLEVQRNLAEAWYGISDRSGLKPLEEKNVHVRRTIEEAVQLAREIALEGQKDGKTEVFVTGSLHLVGGLLEVLES